MFEATAAPGIVVYYKYVMLVGVFAKNSSFLLHNFCHINLKAVLIIAAAAHHSHFIFYTRSVKIKNILVANFYRRIKQNIIVGRMQRKLIATYPFEAA